MFLEELKKFKETQLRLWIINVAIEVDDHFEDATDKEKEAICEFVYDWVMDADVTVYDICEWIKAAIGDGKLTIQDFIGEDVDYSDIRSIVYWYM